MSWCYRGPVALWSRINRIGKKPSDRLGQQIARAMHQTGEQRDRITRFIYIPKSKDEPLGCYEYTMLLMEDAAPINKKLRNAVNKIILDRDTVTDQLYE